LAILFCGYLLVSGLSMQTSTLGIILRFIPIGLGVGIFQSPNNSAIMGTAPRERLGVVSGLLAITRTMGQTTGIAVLGGIWASRTFFYAGQVYAGGATTAPFSAQVNGQHDTYLLGAVLIFISMSLAVWALVEERRQRARQIATA
jgi:hypothetical protein